ncbi:hypothetical protein FKP32DRAFT_511961 [Trametes sanguinea]|nr:hypothetical protein FKP32DRAFT_511961 [Trametes sanguinea]
MHLRLKWKERGHKFDVHPRHFRRQQAYRRQRSPAVRLRTRSSRMTTCVSSRAFYAEATGPRCGLESASRRTLVIAAFMSVHSPPAVDYEQTVHDLNRVAAFPLAANARNNAHRWQLRGHCKVVNVIDSPRADP